MRLHEPYPTIAARIKQALAEAGMSQADLARRLNTTHEAVSRWLAPTNRIKLEDLREVGNVLGKDIGWFLGAEVPIYDALSLIRADRNLSVAERAALEETYQAFVARRKPSEEKTQGE